MSEFIQLQNQFQSYLLENNNDFLHSVIDTEKVSKETSLKIYKNAYQLRLQEALGESYSILRDYLGNKPFDQLCIDYINQSPSHFRSIRWYGNELPLFLQSHKKYKKMPYLAELARWECVSGLVFDAENTDVLTVDAMAVIPLAHWESLTFKMQPSLYQLNLSWNVVAMWEALSNKKTPSCPSNNTNPVPWIMWRQDLICKYRALSHDEFFAIDAALSGKTFGEICEGLCDFVSEDEAGQRAASLLKGWIVSGLIAERI